MTLPTSELRVGARARLGHPLTGNIVTVVLLAGGNRVVVQAKSLLTTVSTTELFPVVPVAARSRATPDASPAPPVTTDTDEHRHRFNLEPDGIAFVGRCSCGATRTYARYHHRDLGDVDSEYRRRGGRNAHPAKRGRS